MHSSASNRRSSKALSTFVTILLLVCTVFWGWTLSHVIHANSYNAQNATIVATSNSKSNDLSFVVLSSKSPHSNVADSGDEEQFLLYYTHSGFSNQIFAFQRAAQLAWTVNRTLVLPPFYPTGKKIAPFHSMPFLEEKDPLENAVIYHGNTIRWCRVYKKMRMRYWMEKHFLPFQNS